ncbi:MAG TPA: flagellar motor switch phosphatase FliY [Thermoanaerobacterales bacterium]|nr:flagellar motor switch phosphatase FliY [Thermoanaerobacterales bacterium]
MDENILSDDEIKELTRNEEPQENILTREEKDALGEIGNISIGTSATTLYSLLRNKVVITTPNVSIKKINELKKMYPVPFIAIEVSYTKGLSGSNIMIIEENDAKIIADLMMGGDGKNVEAELDEIRLSAVGEAMNQMMGSASTSLSTMLKKDINISPPKLSRINFATDSLEGYFKENEEIVVISFNMQVGDFLDSKILQLMPIPFAKTLVKYLYNLSMSGDNWQQASEKESTVVSDNMQDNMLSFPEEKEEKNKPERRKSITVNPVQFETFQEEPVPPSNASLDLIMDVPLEVTVELGRTFKTIKEILGFSPGSIVELDKMAGEPVDILVNGKHVAKGEVVVIDENFGVRITEIINSIERVNSLQ